MSHKKLSVGMPVWDDYDGAAFSIQNLRLTNDMSNIELIVINTKPDAPGSDSLKSQVLGSFSSMTAGTKYVEAPEIIGPAGAKERVFLEAEGDAVVCQDAHVLYKPNTMNKLIDYYDEHPDTQNLICGPLLHDDLRTISTHFDDVWRGEMWGIWGNAWKSPDGTLFAHLDIKDGNECTFISLEMNYKEIEVLDPVTKEPMLLMKDNYVEALMKKGFILLGDNPDDEFPVPAQGCGMFSCRKDAWLHFNSDFRGFGGEEMYIHTKYRQAGHEVICLGFMKWWHRFTRAHGVTFPLERWDKVRNYVLGHNELKLSLEPVYLHFVESGLFSPEDWEILVKDPIDTLSRPLYVLDDNVTTAEGVYNIVINKDSAINVHMPKLRQLVNEDEIKHVTEFTEHEGSTVAFACGHLEKLISYRSSTSPSEAFIRLSSIVPELQSEMRSYDTIPTIEETDVLFIDIADEKTLNNILHKYSHFVRQQIIIHNITGININGKLAIKQPTVQAIRQFIEFDNHKWFIHSYMKAKNDMLVLLKDDDKYPDFAVTLWGQPDGVGDELKKILESVGIQSNPACDCNRRMHTMNHWGIDRCKRKKDIIVKWIEESQERWGWKQGLDGVVEKAEPSIGAKFSLLVKAITTGLVFHIDARPSHRIPSLIDLAIANAEKTADEKSQRKQAS